MPAVGEALALPLEESNRRLKLVVDKLRETPPERFDFDSWVGHNWQGDPDLSCGTTACGLGLATTIPELRELGLVLARVPSAHCVPWRSTSNPIGYVTIRGVPYRDMYGDSVAAAQKIFGLTSQQARYLFTSGMSGSLSEGATPAELADHILDFIERRDSYLKHLKR